jgi:hypothetical protein
MRTDEGQTNWRTLQLLVLNSSLYEIWKNNGLPVWFFFRFVDFAGWEEMMSYVGNVCCCVSKLVNGISSLCNVVTRTFRHVWRWTTPTEPLGVAVTILTCIHKPTSAKCRIFRALQKYSGCNCIWHLLSLHLARIMITHLEGGIFPKCKVLGEFLYII